MRRFYAIAICLTPVVFLAAAELAHGQGQGPRLYRWVDEHGNVHYSDRVEGANQAERINASGIRLGQQHSALPRTREEARQIEEARRNAQLDSMLLATYRSELELLRAHDESRAALETSIRSAEASTRRIRSDINDRLRDGAGEDHPQVQLLRRQLADEQRRMEQLRTRRLELHERQSTEIDRYRELLVRQDG